MSITVHQIVPNFAFADAVGNQISELAALLDQLGVKSAVYAETYDKRHPIRPKTIDQYRQDVSAEDWTVLHFCLCGRANELVGELPGQVVIYYHNVTPAKFFAPYNPLITTCLRQARRQLKLLANRGRAIAASDYNRHELEGMKFQVDAVAPYIMLLDLLRQGLATPAADEARGRFGDTSRRTWLYVGRIAPNKKVEDILSAFAYYQRHLEPASMLLLVGSAPEKDSYVAFIRALIDDLGLSESVVFPGHLPAEALGVFYEIADAYICLSEHEGFCVPLVEAMSFDLPVVAFASTGMPSTLGDSGVLLHRKEPALVAEVMHEVLTNQALRQGLIARQRRRVADFEPGKMRLQLHRSLIAAGIPLPEPQIT